MIEQPAASKLGNCNNSTDKTAHAGSRTRVTSMGGLYDAATLHVLMPIHLSLPSNFACICDSVKRHSSHRPSGVKSIALRYV